MEAKKQDAIPIMNMQVAVRKVTTVGIIQRVSFWGNSWDTADFYNYYEHDCVRVCVYVCVCVRICVCVRPWHIILA